LTGATELDPSWAEVRYYFIWINHYTLWLLQYSFLLMIFMYII